MKINDKDVNALSSLGLTILQAKAYLALVESGTSTIKEISKTSKVARQDLYRITSELQKKGLVEKVLAVPTEFKAIEITGATSILLHRAHDEEIEMHKKALELMQRHKHRDVKAKPEEREPLFIMIPQKEAIQRTTRALENAQTRMLSVISWRKFSDLMLNARKFRLEKALKRGLKLRFITEKPEDEKQIPKIVKTYRKKYSFDVRYLPLAPPAHMALFDKKEVFLNTSITDALLETPLLWSNSSSLLEVLGHYFENKWLTAMEKL
jgi:sugar-specific transcriptional regulator TrmB